MRQKKKIDKKISILCMVFREDKIGYKDIDHILPFLYFLDKSENIKFKVKLLIFLDEISFKKKRDPRINFLINLRNVELEFLYKNNFLLKIKSFLKLRNSTVLFNFFYRIVNKFYFKYLIKSNRKIFLNNKLLLDYVTSKPQLIITVHHTIKGDISEFIKKLNKKSKRILIPHGTVIMDNNMVHDTHLSKHDNLRHKKNTNTFDYILNTSRRDLDLYTSRGIDRSKLKIIGSPRYCKEWLDIKRKFRLDGKNVFVEKKYKVKFLFLIPKPFINIFFDELIRTIDFISSYKEIELILLSDRFNYPDLPDSISSRSNIRRYIIAKEYSTSKLIEWADIILHVGTGVMFESFMKEKITVLPRYLSSNTLISEKYKAGWNLNNRDQLRKLCNTAVSSLSFLKKKYKKETRLANKKFIDDFVYGNTKSVPKKIQNFFLKNLKDIYYN